MNGAEKSFIVATAGHVDHGKSSLIESLTGSHPDRLPEEKARGITIDLGFAHLRLPGPAAGESLRVGIVDVPGHEDLIKNMVAGVGAIDLALLVVAADDGWMPQTEEHVQILEYLGVTRAVVALTKADRLEPANLTTALARLEARLAGTGFAGAPIVVTSTRTGQGREALRAALARALAPLPPARDIGRPRLWIDRSFGFHGVGRIVTGTLTGGAIAAGDCLEIAGSGAAVRVRSVQNYNQTAVRGFPGTRTALNLVAAESHGHDAVLNRGDLLTGQHTAAAPVVDVRLFRSPRADAVGPRAPVSHGAAMRCHIGTTTAMCRIVFADAGGLRAGEEKLAELRFERPLALVAGERFVIRDPTGRSTLAGGIVLDAGADSRRFRHPEQLRYLQACAQAGGDSEQVLRARVARDRFVRRSALEAAVPGGREELAAKLERLRRAGDIVLSDDLVALATVWQAILDRAETEIAAHQAAHPTQNGLPLSQLRQALRPTPEFAVEAAVRALTGNDCEVVGAAIRRRDFRPSCPAALRGTIDRLLEGIRAAGLHVPGRTELARTSAEREAIEFAVKTGELIAIGPDVVLHRNVYDSAQRRIASHLAGCGGATVSELKQVLGTTRRVMVPLLERLDRERITVRTGELRRLAVALSGRHGPPGGVLAVGSSDNRD